VSFDELKLSEADIEIIDGDRGVNYPKQNEFYDIGYCLFLNAKNVTKDGFDFNEKSFISREKDNLLRKGKLVRNDIVLTTRGTVGNVAFYNNRVPFNNIRINSGMVILRAKQSEYLPEFVYWMFRSNYIQDQINALKTGSAQPQLPITIMRTIKVLKPKLWEQKAIAATLSALDDMIELNNQINKTLEEMAQAIFKSWFVDFEPFKDGEFEESELGLIPKGWRVGCIGDYVKVKSGFAFKSSWWETSGVPVIKIKEIDNYTINFGDVSYVSEDKAALAKDFRVNGGDLLIAMTGATIGKFAIVPKMPSFAVVNQRVGKFFLGDNPLEKLGFIYCILKQDNVYKEIVSRGEGSAQPNISPSGIESIKIVLPPERLINEYNQLVMKFFKMIIENTAENALLICLRDTLLPKLMSGEIRVPVEEVV
jgi:type I restriction enzyme S subunit